jgi:glycosyltransferase involved in cell wall biosynthesis
MYTKGVVLALEVAARVGERLDIEIVRLSTFRQSDEERRRFAPSRFLCGEPPAAVADMMRTADLTLTLPTGEEGFGLPALESLASGVPVVCSPTSAYRDLLASGGARTSSPPTVDAYADLVAAILTDPSAWLDMRRWGLVVAGRHRVAARRARLRHIADRILGGSPDFG